MKRPNREARRAAHRPESSQYDTSLMSTASVIWKSIFTRACRIIRNRAPNEPPERYFYHSFPRVASNADEINKGCQILAAIRDFGLLLTPQLIEWRQPSSGGVQPRAFPVLQQRVCFTELAPHELPKHAQKFGHFALEFEIDTIRQLGAVPVYYVPQPTGEAADGSHVATALFAVVMDANAVVSRLTALSQCLDGPTPVPERFQFDVGFARNSGERAVFSISRDEAKNILAAIGHQVTPWADFSAGTNALLNFFHPTDDVKHDKMLDYYREREWRIACNFAMTQTDGSRVGVLLPVTQAIRERCLGIDAEFFGRKILTDMGEVDTLDRVLVHPGLNGVPLITMARRVIVPTEALDQTTQILSALDHPPKVVAMDDIQC
jgi:hypothetical protein